MLMHSFKATTAPLEILAGVRSGLIPAFCFFQYNVLSPAQLHNLSLSLYRAAEEGGLPPPIIGIDQEGGQLIAVTNGATELPGNMALGATRSASLAREAGQVLARELLAMGVNMNFAPSVDINTNPYSPGIGTRSFGDNPHLVGELGTAMIEGMQGEGLIATAKHFPGHGSTTVDSHYDLPVVDLPRERLEAVELVPFKSVIKAGVGCIMSAHIRVDALDPVNPGTLSRRILTDLLREEMDYDGLIVTDAMDMDAVARLGHERIVNQAIAAGADLILLGHLPNQFALTDQSKPYWTADSLERIRKWREKLLRADQLPPMSVVGCAEHQAVAQRIADAAVTLTHGELPLRVNGDDLIAIITVQPKNLTPADTSGSAQITLAEAITKRHANTRAIQVPRSADDAAIREALWASDEATAVVIGTLDAFRDESQRVLVKALNERGQRVYIAALRTPYDAAVLANGSAAVLCTYSMRPASCESAARALFGEIPTQGILPCRIDDVK